MQKITIKRGETMEIFGTLIKPDQFGVAQPLNISTWQLFSQVRDPKKDLELVAVVTVTKGNQTLNPGSYSLRANTANWASARLLCDVAFIESDGDIKLSETIEIIIENSITVVRDFNVM